MQYRPQLTQSRNAPPDLGTLLQYQHDHVPPADAGRAEGVGGPVGQLARLGEGKGLDFKIIVAPYQRLFSGSSLAQPSTTSKPKLKCSGTRTS